MKNKIYFIIGYFLFFSLEAWAQGKDLPQSLSMSEAEELALTNNPELRVESLQKSIADKKIEQVRWEKIPDIYADFNIKSNLLIPITPVPAKAFDPSAPEGKIIPLRFMTRWTGGAGINANFDLFNPERNGKEKETKQELFLQETDEKMAQQRIAYETRVNYVACLIAEEQVNLAIADTLSKHQILKATQERYEQGQLKLTDKNTIRLKKNEAVSTYLEAEKILQNSQAKLLTSMGIALSQIQFLSLSDQLEDLFRSFQGKDHYSSENLTLKRWKQQQELTFIQLRNTKMEYLPSLSLNGFYGGNYFDQSLNVFKSQNWYGNSYIGLSLKIPITQGLDRAKRAAILHLQLEADKANFLNAENNLKLQRFELQNELRFREKDRKQKEKDLEWNRQNLEAITDQYSNGRVTIDEWLEGNYQLRKAENAYLQSVYDYISIQLELENSSKE